jgi:tRNA pseudouridine55 synthase
MSGVLLVDKPCGVSSAGVIRALTSRLGRVKVGHLGTLDPFASGLLPLVLGEATKVARYLLVEQKAYTGTIRLGRATDTLDCTGTTTETAPVPALQPPDVDAVGRRFTGPQRQVPPMYSALKRDGVPLYKLARQGLEVERTARDIEIVSLSLTLVAPDGIEFAVVCSKGTYVRVLAADVGAALGTVAHLETLRRTAVGAFRVGDSHTVEALREQALDVPLPLISIRDALADFRAFGASGAGIERLRRGQQGMLAELPPPGNAGETALVADTGGRVAAVIEAAGSRWRLVRLLADA